MNKERNERNETANNDDDAPPSSSSYFLSLIFLFLVVVVVVVVVEVFEGLVFVSLHLNAVPISLCAKHHLLIVQCQSSAGIIT